MGVWPLATAMVPGQTTIRFCSTLRWNQEYGWIQVKLVQPKARCIRHGGLVKRANIGSATAHCLPKGLRRLMAAPPPSRMPYLSEA